MRARVRQCFGPRLWLDAVVQGLLDRPRSKWMRLELGDLARLIEADVNFQSAFFAHEPPRLRRYILRSPTTQGLPPLALEGAGLPLLPTPGDMARCLGITPGGLWRLSLPSAWQRRRPLGEQHYHCRWMPKPSGGWRLIEAPEPYLRAVQRRLLDRLLVHATPHEAAHGGVRGRSVVTHAAAHVGQAVVWHFDLRDFFGSVRAARVHATLRALGYRQAVCSTLTALCTVATPEPVLQRLREADLGSPGEAWQHVQRLRDPHLPQGAPTSTALANLCAFNLDLRLSTLAREWGASYTRYVDDLVFSGGAALLQASERFARWVARIVAEEGFVLNRRKTRRSTAGTQQQVAGVVVNQQFNIARRDFDRLKACLHRHALGGPQPAVLREPLRGRIEWVNQLNPGKAQRLMRLFERIDWAD